MTRIESTSSPSSQTARANRSTSTFVLPVPAPAETKTSPVASTAACCSGFIWASRALHPADGPEVAPRRARAAARVVLHVACADALRERAGVRSGRLEARPELVVLDVVVLRESRQVL